MKRLTLALIPLLCFSALASCALTDTKPEELTIIFPEEQTEIVFSAAAPIGSWKIPQTTYARFTNYTKEDYDVFADFTDYYQKNIRKKVDGCFYLLDPGEDSLSWISHGRTKSFYLVADEYRKNKFVNPVITEHIKLKDDSLAEPKPNPDEPTDICEGDYNIYLSIRFLPVKKNLNKINYYLEFGNNNVDGCETYVNIYREKTCIATCFYETHYATVTYQWFRDYFTNNLLLED